MEWQTQCLEIGPDPETDPGLDQAAAFLAADELVAFPTETVYGLGGNALSKTAIEKIFIAKNRPSDNPLIVHIGSREQVGRFSDSAHPLLDVLAQAFWPGPLTLVLPVRPEVRDIVSRGLDTVALRVPNHPLALALLRRCGLGIAAPSANLSGRPSPTRASHVLKDLRGRIPLILDGGPCRIGIESTVLSLCQAEPVILRPGSVTPLQLEKVLGFAPNYSDTEFQKKHSPGTRYRHYSPSMPVLLIDPSLTEASFQHLLDGLKPKAMVGYLGPRKTPIGIQHIYAEDHSLAALLFQVLRDWEDAGLGYVIVEATHEEEAGFSLMDRLKKAASHHLRTEQEVQAYLNLE